MISINNNTLLCYLFSLFLLWPFHVYARAIESIVIPPAQARAGEPVTVTLYFHNSGDKTIRHEVQNKIFCRLRLVENSEGQIIRFDSKKNIPFVTLATGEFFKKKYIGIIPESLFGIVTMEAVEIDSVPVMFQVQPAKEIQETENVPAKNDPEEEYDTLEQLFSLYQPYIGNITAYEPMYFLPGLSLEKSKFQLSFKYRFFNPEASLAKKIPWLSSLHLGYTQTSFWDLKSSSKPFEDTSYKPEFFFLSPDLFGEKKGKPFFLQAGVQHESNGRGGEFSRSTNTLYLKPIWVFFDEENLFGLQIAPKFWTYILNEDENNREFKDYRGYFDLEFKVGKADHLVAETHLRYAKKGASLQFDITYPLHRYLNGNLDFYLHAQYVNTLAESMLHYRDRTETFRLGISIVR